MDLEEWIEKQKDIDHKFRKKLLCKLLHIHPTTLSRILSGQVKPSYWVSMQIEKVTKGEIKAFDIVTERSKCRFCECGRAYKYNIRH